MKSLPVLLVLICCKSFSQVYQWAPTNSPTGVWRYEDVYFLNPDTGFAVHYNEEPFGGLPGYIIKTVDGGTSWIKVVDSSESTFRDIGFTDALHGWAGTFEHSNTGADTNILYQTVDGGLNWTGVANLPGPDSSGICGLRVINSTTIYGVGRYEGHAGFYKTTDNGLTWNYTSLDLLASGAVDIFFFDADTGFVCATTGPLFSTGYGRILYTTDAGNTWSIVHTSSHYSTLGWKISFPSRNTGYCSLQSFNFPPVQYFLKTTDGGLTWQEIPYIGGPSGGYNIEGMGFINDTTGWVGGDVYIYFTQNGGTSWTQQTWGNNLNRFRFLSDTLAYAAGQKIYKMHFSATGIHEIISDAVLGQSYPNPASGSASFEFFVYKASRFKLAVYDLQGKEIAVLFDKFFSYGNKYFTWKPAQIPEGVYMYRLFSDNQAVSKKLIIVKN